MSAAPRQLGNATLLVDAVTMTRVKVLIGRIGFVEARTRLHVSDHTLEQARDGDRMKRETRDRIVEALTREEAKAS